MVLIIREKCIERGLKYKASVDKVNKVLEHFGFNPLSDIEAYFYIEDLKKYFHVTRERCIQRGIIYKASVDKVNKVLEHFGFNPLSDVEVYLYIEDLKKYFHVTREKCIQRGIIHKASIDKVNKVLDHFSFNCLSEHECKILFQHSYMLKSKKYWMSLIGDGVAFEKEVANFFQKKGYTVNDTKVTGDHGIDLFLINGFEKVIVQCKAHTLKLKECFARDLNGVLHSNYAQGANRAILVSINGFTKDCIKFMKENGIEYLALQDLCLL